MIDVHHPDAAELRYNAGSQRSRAHGDTRGEHAEDEQNEDEEDEEEAAWLESVQAGNLTDVQGVQNGGLVLDASQLRGEHSAAKKSLKANVGS